MCTAEARFAYSRLTVASQLHGRRCALPFPTSMLDGEVLPACINKPVCRLRNPFADAPIAKPINIENERNKFPLDFVHFLLSSAELRDKAAN